MQKAVPRKALIRHPAGLLKQGLVLYVGYQNQSYFLL